MPIGCHFQDCEALLVMSLTCVESGTASTGHSPLPLSITTHNTHQANRHKSEYKAKELS